MTSRREFLGSAIGVPAAAAMLPPAAFASLALSTPRGRSIVEEIASTPCAGDEASLRSAATDEDFWAMVQQAFTADRTIVNLNNGGVSPSPMVVQESVKRHLDHANSAPPVTLWRHQAPRREMVRQRLARGWGADPEEIAITRNSSESLQICQLGLDLSRGDEVLTTTQDYPRMLTTFRQRERREGIRLVQVRIPVPCEDVGLMVRRIEEGITPRTKLILICHVVNITGQIMPVREIVAMARGRNGGIPVIVDGAHAMGQFDYSFADLSCDYYGVSLHKWMCCPHGTGLLYVRREKIAGLWPMMAAEASLDGDIRKFEEIGTHPAGNVLAIAEALTFHQAIGGKRKEARLRHLRDSWARPLLDASPRVRLHTSLRPEFSCALGTFDVEGMDPGKLASHLWNAHRIVVTTIKHPEFQGNRVSPSVYTTPEEIGRFVDAVTTAIRTGIPGEGSDDAD